MAIVTTTLLSSVDTHADLSSSPHRLSGLSISVGVGISSLNQRSITNNTEAIPPLLAYPPTKDNPPANTFAKFSSSFKPVFVAGTTGSDNDQALTGNWVRLPGWYSSDSKDALANLDMPTMSPVTVPVVKNDNGSSSLAPNALNEVQVNSLYNQNTFVTPYIDYSQINTLNGAIGIDVKGGFGYKMPLNNGLYVHPSLNFGYFNAQSDNAVATCYHAPDIFVRSTNAKFVTTDATNGAATLNQNVAGNNANAYTKSIFNIYPDTYTFQLETRGPSIAHALTHQALWYWQFVTSLGCQLNEGLSCEVICGYQMTRFQLSLLESNGEFQNQAVTFDKGSPTSTILNSIGRPKEMKPYYRFEDANLGSVEESASRMVSGLVLGVGLNFAIASRTTLGVQLSQVFNAARDYEIADVKGSPSAASSATTQGQTSSQNGSTDDNALNGTVRTFSAQMSQHQTSILVNLTYFFPMGSECNPGA